MFGGQNIPFYAGFVSYTSKNPSSINQITDKLNSTYATRKLKTLSNNKANFENHYVLRMWSGKLLKDTHREKTPQN